MDVCFISGPYLPGECGISDYIDRLSFQLNNQGVNCIHITIDENRSLAYIANELPKADLYSLQYTPYNFDYKVLNYGLIKLSDALKNKNTHINFHEIWIGAYPGAGLIEKFVGFLQKRQISNFVNKINPAIVTCSNSAVMDRLERVGIKSKYLYLFGNIPFYKDIPRNNKSKLIIVFFGTPYTNFPYELLAYQLTQIASILRKEVKIKIIGRHREKQGVEKIEKICKRNGFTFIQLGSLPANDVSKEIQSCDVGISTTPYDIIGKSGATASMLEHGLPVLAFDDGDTPEKKLFILDQFQNQVFLLNQKSTPDRLASHLEKPRARFFDGVAYTAKIFQEYIC